MIKQLMRFGAVGILATLLHLLVFGVLVETFNVAGLIANLVAFVFAFSLAFIGHFRWTFHKDSQSEIAWHKAMIKFWVVALIGLAINSSIAYLIVDRGQLSFLIAVALMATITPVVTFVISKIWAFSPR